VIASGWADGTDDLTGSAGPPDVTVAPGQVGTWTGQIKGKEKDVLPFCFQSIGVMGDRPTECHPASVFLGRLPSPPLRLLLTVAGPRFAYLNGRTVAYPESAFSIAQVEAPRKNPPPVLRLPGQPRQKVETIKRPEAKTSQGGFVP
jgi:hypothetical protein